MGFAGSAIYVAFAGKPDHKLATIAAIVIVFAGLLFILLHALRTMAHRVVPSASGQPTSTVISRPGARLQAQSRVRQTLALLPNVTLLCAVALMVLLAVFISVGPLPSRGLWVLVTPDLLAKEHADPAGPVVVFLKLPRKAVTQLPTRLFVHESETDGRNLRGALLNQLSRRADWVVFIDADPSLPYADAVQVVDVVSQLSARPVLLIRKPAIQPGQPNKGHDSQYSPSQPTVIFRAIADSR